MKNFIRYLYKNFGHNVILFNIFLLVVRGINPIPDFIAWSSIILITCVAMFTFIYVTYSETETLLIKFLKKFVEPVSLIAYLILILYIGMCNDLLLEL